MQTTTVTTIPAQGVQVYINAADRHPTDSVGFFKIGSSIIADNSAFGHVSAATIVKEIILENLIPTISPGQNDQLMYTVNGVTFIAIFEDGLYDAITLEASIRTELQLRDAGFDIVYNSNSKKYTVTVPNGFTLTFLRPSSSEFMPQAPFRETSPYARFLSMIGFWNDANTLITGPTTITGSAPVLLSTTPYVDICLSSSTTQVLSTSPFGQEKIMARIPVRGSYGDLIYYKPAEKTSSLNLNSLEGSIVQLRDCWRNTLQLPHNAKFSIELLILPGGLSSAY